MTPELQQMMQAALETSRFPMGAVIVCILVATACIAVLMVLAWFLFKTRFPRSFDSRQRRE